MPRPRADIEAKRQRLMEAAEALLQREGGRRLILSEVAAAVGMTQSNAYRYFRSKDELVEALAERWFTGLETAVSDAMGNAPDEETAIREWLMVTMTEKLGRYDTNPAIFLAYLELAREHMPAAHRHASRLRRLLERPVSALVGMSRLQTSLDVLENATMLFRNPFLIPLFRERMTIGNATAVLDIILASFRGELSEPNRDR